MAPFARLKSCGGGLSSSCCCKQSSRLCCCGGGGCCCKSSRWRRFRAKLPSKLLLKVYIITFLNLFCNAFAITMLFPFLPFMMEFLIPKLQDDQKSVGKYVGFIGGSLFFGRVFGGYLWGVIADRKGRKPVMIISVIFIAAFVLAFGFSINFAMALITRFFVGFFNGTVATSKAVLSEVSDDSNQAFGLTLLGTAWGTGYIIGPAISGALADPIGQYNLTITNSFLHGYLSRFPYSLPSIVNFLLFVITMFVNIFLLPETRGMKKNRKRSEIDQEAIELIARQATQQDEGDGDDDNERGTGDSPHISTANEAEANFCKDQEEVEDRSGDEEKLLSADEDSLEEANRTGSLFITNPIAVANSSLMTVDLSSTSVERGNTAGHRLEEEENEEGGEVMAKEPAVTLLTPTTKKHNRKFLSALKNLFLDLRLFFCDRAPLISLVLYSIYSFAAIGFSELFSLWAYTQPHLGGLGLSLRQIGITLTIVGILILPVNLVAFPVLEKRLRSIKCFYLIGLTLTFIFPLMPTVHYLIVSGHSWLFWGVLVIMTFLINASITIGFSAIFMFINNSVTFDKLGSINGIATAMTSITRSFSPVVLGAIFSASLSDATLEFGYPVDYNLVFVILSVTILICVLMVACLPVSINRQKIIEDV